MMVMVGIHTTYENDDDWADGLWHKYSHMIVMLMLDIVDSHL